MALIRLTRGYQAIVDDADYEFLSQWKWHAAISGKRVLARRDKRAIYMHRELLDCPSELEVDHINGDTLDNRRVNLRCCLPQQNRMAKGKYENNTTGYKGVQVRQNGKYMAVIQAAGRSFYGGTHHKTPEEAAHAYDALAVIHHGKFARLNFPTGGDNRT